MDAWNIYHKDGSVLCDVDGNQVMFTSLENTDVWMGECSVSITVKNNSPVIFSIGDYVIYRNERYEINYDPGKIKASSKNTYGEGFVYNDIKFNSLSDELVRAEFLDVVLFEGTVNVDGIETPLHYTALPKFSFYVEFIDDLLDRIQANMNEQYGDGVWKIFSTNMERSVVRGCSESDWHNAYGDESKYIAIDSQSITVDNSTCWDALSLVNSKWDITFIVRGRNVYVGINGPKTPHVFKYGKGNGLREIEQTVDSEQNVITRLRAYGSDKNMPQRYYAELGKKCFANVTKVDKSVSNSIEITTDLPYNSTLFNTPRTYKTSEDSETFTLGWALKVTFDFQTVVTAHIEPTTTQDGYCIVHTELGEPYDTGDELDSVKLQKFIESASVGKKMYFTRGIYKSAFEKEFIEFDNNMPNNMAVNRLMLPGFPDTSLSAFWNTMTDEEKKYVSPTGSNIIFSEDKYRPYLDSPEKENAGLRQYSMYFDNDDKKNGIIEIYPTIEEMVVSGERIDEISVGSSINDDGVFDDGQDVKDFYIKLKKQIDFDLNDVKNDDFSISLKDGMCGGRTFKINECTKESDGSWSLKCARVKDDALELWFPYKDYPIRNGDHFVLTGLELPDSYIRAASIKLLKYSISYLNSNCKTRYAFQLKVDDLFMARQHDLSVSDSSGATKSLYKTLRAGDVMSIRDEDLGIDSDIVIEQLTIKEEEGNIPSYEITLRDDKEVGTIHKIQQQISSLQSGNGGTGAGLTTTQVKNLVATEGSKHFISKINDDTAKGTITWEKLQKFLQGLQVGSSGEYRIDRNGVATLYSIIINALQSTDYNEATQSGFGFVKRNDGKYRLDITDLLVWGKAIFHNLEIRNLYSVGGAIDLSPSASRIVRVEEVFGEETGEMVGWKCYLLADDGTMATTNQWMVDDQARCQTFNIAEGVYQNVSNKNYWRRVTQVSKTNEQITDENGNVLYDGKKFAWIVLSKTDCMEGSDVPSADDVIVCRGNRTLTDRQHIIVMETVGEKAPSVTLYHGVNGYSLTNKSIFSLSLAGVRATSEFFEFISSDGDKIWIANYLGYWSETQQYKYYDEVSWMGTRWLCIVPEGSLSTEEPSEESDQWRATTNIFKPQLVLTTDLLQTGIARGETHTVVCTLMLGDKDVTSSVTAWKVERKTADAVADRAWAAKDKVKNFAGSLTIVWADDNSEDDLGDGDTASFTFTATTTSGAVHKTYIEI